MSKLIVETIKPQTDAKLREFGVVMALAFSILSALLFYRGKPFAPHLALVSSAFLFFGLYFPRLLAPLEKAWMAFSEKLSIVMTFLILLLTFFLVITPMAIFLRLLRKDLLQIRLQPVGDSYWNNVEKNGPQTRSFVPY